MIPLQDDIIHHIEAIEQKIGAAEHGFSRAGAKVYAAAGNEKQLIDLEKHGQARDHFGDGNQQAACRQKQGKKLHAQERICAFVFPDMLSEHKPGQNKGSEMIKNIDRIGTGIVQVGFKEIGVLRLQRSPRIRR